MSKKSSENVRELKRRLETQKKKNIMNTICKFLCAAAGLALIFPNRLYKRCHLRIRLTG